MLASIIQPAFGSIYTVATNTVSSTDLSDNKGMQAMTVFVTIYGTLGALSGLFQLQRIHRTGSAQDISIRFMFIYSLGYLIWLVYGIITKDIALIVVDLVGVIVSSIVLGFALYLKIVDGGQSVSSALFDKSSSIRGSWSLHANSNQEDEGKKPPKSLDEVVFSQMYPLRRINRIDKDPCSSEIGNLHSGLPGQIFFQPTATIREIDGGSNHLWKPWREQLAFSTDFLIQGGIDLSDLQASTEELSRRTSSKPALERFNKCRIYSVLAAAIERKQTLSENEDIDFVFQGISKAIHRGCNSTEHRWLEQKLGTFYLPDGLIREDDKIIEIKQKFPDFLDISSSATIIEDPIHIALLWPVQAGINDYWGGPGGRSFPIIKADWLSSDHKLALATTLAKESRPNDLSWSFSIHPFDFSMNNGWQSLLIEKYISDVIKESLWNFYPLERSFLAAVARSCGISSVEMIRIVGETDFSQTGFQLARLSGINIDSLMNLYSSNYYPLAKKLLPIKDHIDQRRLEEVWLKLLR